MDKIDNIIFGDNQFFGINHMSEEKAQALAEKFYDINSIYKVYDDAFSCGINAVMLNSNERAGVICDYFRANASKYKNINWYPSVPYPHKYANLVAEKGIFPAISEVLLKNNTAVGTLSMVAKGGMAVLGKNPIKMMQMLVDAEFRIFKGLNVKVLFLQNIVVDLLLGLSMKDFFYEYCEFVRRKYNVLPGFITQNLPILKKKLEEWNIENVVLCSSCNKIGYLMSPSVDAYVDCIKNNDLNKYQIIAMSTLASGAIKPDEAYKFINNLNLQSVVFGASQKQHIQQTVDLINAKKI